jgi:N6-adenine-specific methylase
MRIIAGKYGRRRLDPPRGLNLRPTTDRAKEALFNSLSAQYEIEKLRVLDLFAGTGGISLEFVSRGVNSVTAIERQSKHASYIRCAADILDKEILTSEQLVVITRPVEQYLRQYDGPPYDLIFADPPYDLPWLANIPSLVFASKAWGHGTAFVLEHPSSVDFSRVPHFAWHKSYSTVQFTCFLNS